MRVITASRRSTNLEELNGAFRLGIASKPTHASCSFVSPSSNPEHCNKDFNDLLLEVAL